MASGGTMPMVVVQGTSIQKENVSLSLASIFAQSQVEARARKYIWGLNLYQLTFQRLYTIRMTLLVNDSK